ALPPLNLAPPLPADPPEAIAVPLKHRPSRLLRRCIAATVLLLLAGLLVSVWPLICPKESQLPQLASAVDEKPTPAVVDSSPPRGGCAPSAARGECPTRRHAATRSTLRRSARAKGEATS